MGLDFAAVERLVGSPRGIVGLVGAENRCATARLLVVLILHVACFANEPCALKCIASETVRNRIEGLGDATSIVVAPALLLEEAELTIGGRPVRAVTGETVLMPADVPHAVSAIRPFKMLLIMIRN